MAGSLNWLRYANTGATRNLPLNSHLAEALGFLPEMGLTAEVFSGGQPRKGSGLARVGSTRHDDGNAADVRFFQGDRQLDWANADDRPAFEEIVRRGKAAGITGFGAGPGYMAPGTMHVGYGAPGVWGAGGKAANAPDWLREAYGAGGAVGGGAAKPMPSFNSLTATNGTSAMAAEPKKTGAAAAIDTATGGDMAGRNYQPAARDGNGGRQLVAGPSTQAAGPVLDIAPQQDTSLEDAMIARSIAGGSNVDSPWEAISSLVQAWAAQRSKTKKMDANKETIAKAIAGAGLDPDMAMTAQLGGTRESLADALVAQRQSRTQAAQREQELKWRQEGRDYDQGRDRVADQRFQQTQDYQQGRDAASDARANRTLDLQERIATQKAEPYKTLTRQEVVERGLPPGAYQEGPGGKIDAIGKGGVTVNNGSDESEFAKKAAGKMADRFSNLSEGGTAAANVLQTLPQMRELLTVAPQGPIQGRLAETFPGFSSAADAFGAGINQIAPSLRIPGSGAQSDRDMDILLGSFPRLRNDPAANTVIMDAFETKARINMQRADIANAALRGEIKPDEADRRLGELDRTSIIPEGMRQRLGITKPPETGIKPSAGRPRATNPQTGQIVEFDGKQWVPAQ